MDAYDQEHNQRGRALFLENKEYLADIYLLAKCNSLLSAGSSGDIMAYIINNKNYEHFSQISAKYDSDTHLDD